MRSLSFLLIAALGAFGQIPAVDSRVANVPGTNTHFTMPEYKTLAEWEAHKAHLRKQILSAAGLLPMPEKTPLNPRVFGRLERKDYSIEKVCLETMPGYYLGGNLYRPLGRSGKFPGIATPHGHWTYGRLENQPLASIPARAINLARQGYVVFSYDMVGYNDTVQTPHVFGGPAEQLWSFGPLALQLWNSIRVVDFLESLPDVDPRRLAATGASGGGTQTFMLAAVDDRIRYDAPVNMVSAYMQGGSPCENAPGLRFDTSNLEIAALMAPRPMLLVSATGDWTQHVPQEEYPAIRRIYELYGKANNIEVVQFDAPHNYDALSREAVYRFFGKHILGQTDAEKFAEKTVLVEKPHDLLVFHGRAFPENALGYDALFTQWKEACQRQSAKERDPGVVRERLLYALGVEWPAEVLSQTGGEKLVLSRKGRGDRVPALWIEGSGAPALVVHPGGIAPAQQSAEVRKLISERRAVLLIEAFAHKRDQSGGYFLTFNRSDDANRVQDILTALAFLRSRHSGKVELHGLGKAGVWCLFAAAVAPGDLKLMADLRGFAGKDEDFIKDFFVPGIQRAGGLEAALMLTANRSGGGSCSNALDYTDATYGGRIRQLRKPDGHEHNLYYSRDPWNADMTYMVGIQSDREQKNGRVVLYDGNGCYRKDLFPMARFDWRLTWDRKEPAILYTWWGSELYRFNVETGQAQLLKSFAPLRLKPCGPSINQAGDRILVITSDNTFRSYHLPDMRDERAFTVSYPEGCVTGWDKEKYIGYRNYVLTFCRQAVFVYDDNGQLFHRFDGVGGGGHHDFSPDGKWAYFKLWTKDRPLEIHVVNIDGTNDRIVLSVPPEQVRYLGNLHLAWPRNVNDWFIASFFPNAQRLPARYAPYLDEIVQIRTDGTHRVLARSETAYSAPRPRSGGPQDMFWAQPLGRPSADGSRINFNSNRSGDVDQCILFVDSGPANPGTFVPRTMKKEAAHPEGRR